jgi:hypothetical protein
VTRLLEGLAEAARHGAEACTLAVAAALHRDGRAAFAGGATQDLGRERLKAGGRIGFVAPRNAPFVAQGHAADCLVRLCRMAGTHDSKQTVDLAGGAWVVDLEEGLELGAGQARVLTRQQDRALFGMQRVREAVPG